MCGVYCNLVVCTTNLDTRLGHASMNRYHSNHHHSHHSNHYHSYHRDQISSSTGSDDDNGGNENYSKNGSLNISFYRVVNRHADNLYSICYEAVYG